MSRQYVIIPAKAAFDERLTPMQLKTLMALGYHTDKSGWCWPRMSTMAALLGVGHPTISKAIGALEVLGYVRVERSKQRGNRYHVVTDFSQFDVPVGTSDVPVGTSDVPPDGTTVVPSSRNNTNENKEREKKNERIAHEIAFVDFWAAYPRRVAKGLAVRAWAKAVKSGVEPGDIIAGAKRYADLMRGSDPKFTKHPATWLNGQCWEDEDPIGVEEGSSFGGRAIPWVN